MNQEQIQKLQQERASLLEKLSQFKDITTPKKNESPVIKGTNMPTEVQYVPSKLTQFAKVFDSESYQIVQEMSVQPGVVNDILGLNEKLISTLEQADGQLQAVNQINEKLSSDLKTREQVIEQYKQKEAQELKNKFDAKLNHVTQKWCEVFSLSDVAKQQEARKMLSTFQSEDKLAEIESFLAHKMSVMSNQPQPVTKQSDELVQIQDKKVPQQKPVHLMTNDEKKQYTEMLYQKIASLQK